MIRIKPDFDLPHITREEVEKMPEPARTRLLLQFDHHAKIRRETEPEVRLVIQDLEQVGYIIESLYDLVNSSQRYPEAIPVLCKHLKLAKHPLNREAIARSLITTDARGVAGQTILNELVSKRSAYHDGAPPTEKGDWNDVSPTEQRARHKHRERFALALALSQIADSTLTEDLRVLVTDPRFNDVQKELRKALKKSTQSLKQV